MNSIGLLISEIQKGLLVDSMLINNVHLICVQGIIVSITGATPYLLTIFITGG